MEKIKTRFTCNFFFFENLAKCETMWEKHGGARQATDDNIIRRRRDAICVPDNEGKNTDTHF